MQPTTRITRASLRGDFKTGNYVCYFLASSDSKPLKLKEPFFSQLKEQYILIRKEDERIADEVLRNENALVQCRQNDRYRKKPLKWKELEKSFFKIYDEQLEYRIKPSNIPEDVPFTKAVSSHSELSGEDNE